MADSKAGIAHLADEIWIPTEQFDPLLLAKSQLPQPGRHLGRGRKPFDADNRASLNTA